MTLKEIRKKAGLSQKELAEKSGVTIKNIQHYESGYRNINMAKLETLAKIAVSLNCQISDILTSEELKELYNKAK